MRAFLIAFLCCVLSPVMAAAQDLQTILQLHADEVESPGRQTVGVVIDDLLAAGLPTAPAFLGYWQDRQIVRNQDDGLFYRAGPSEDGTQELVDLHSGEVAMTAPTASLTEVRPNGGVRRELGAALVRFQLADPDPAVRRSALSSIARSPDADQIGPLEASITDEPDAGIRAEKERLRNILAARFGDTPEDRIEAIRNLGGSIAPISRAALAQILSTTEVVAQGEPDGNVASVLRAGSDLTRADAYARLVDAGFALPRVSDSDIRDALIANIADGTVGGWAVSDLDTVAERRVAYVALAAEGTVPPFITDTEIDAALSSHTIAVVYDEDDPAITEAAEQTLAGIDRRVAASKGADLAIDAVSLASIYFLAAIGLAITFGVMGVINMAHGEFIMMGAYTGYVVQQFVPDYTLSLIIALPLAFVVTAGAGVAMERLVIRYLYHRPLETLLATFGISIALQQLAKNIFGTQAKPLTAPGWLDGQWVMNEIIGVSYIRVAIFVLALLFLGLLLFILNRTRLGLEVRAVTQNPGMAASMGIDPDKINMATFALGSGIAGIAGVAIGLYAQVTSEMGANYIVQSFMTVVVGGVGNVWGTLAGAGLIGMLQKTIESFNPSNTLAAQTFMILFIIIFIQFRPRGIVALKGRAAGD